VYLSTGKKTVFTDFRDAKPRAREVFHFHKPETLLTWAKQKQSLRNSFQDLPAYHEHFPSSSFFWSNDLMRMAR
jgi:type I restriction enzyme R subunit